MEIVNLNHIVPEGSSVNLKKEQTLEKLFRVMKQKHIVKVKVDQVRQAPTDGKETTFVWKVEFDGINGIIEFENSGLEHKNQMQQFVGQEVFVRIKKVNRNPAYVIADRKSALDTLKLQLFEQLNEGMVINSVVKGIGNNELYVDIGGGYTVPLHRKEATLSSARKSLRRFFDIGERVRVKILSIDKKAQKIQVSHTATLKNPWDIYNFMRKDVVVGEVVNISSSKAIFVEVEHGLDAIVTVPDLPIEIKIGDKIQGVVTKFDSKDKKFRLRFKNKIEAI